MDSSPLVTARGRRSTLAVVLRLGLLVVAGVGTAVSIRWTVVSIVDDGDSFNASAAVFRVMVVAAVGSVFLGTLVSLLRITSTGSRSTDPPR